MKKKKIAWITHDCFVDVDLPVIGPLSRRYDIVWYILLPETGSRFTPGEIEKCLGAETQTETETETETKAGTVEIHTLPLKYRYRDPRRLGFYWKLFGRIRRGRPDCVYINFFGLPYLAPACALRINRGRVIFAAHQAVAHEGMRYRFITDRYFRFIYGWFRHFNFFSKGQADLFVAKYKQPMPFITPLGLKSFGTPAAVRAVSPVVFLCFGTIRFNKNVGCLIEAAQLLHEKGVGGFRVDIAGECDTWETYRKQIRYPELFRCDIRSVANTEIPDLFAASHYLVLPYTTVTQSGPLKIAFHYNLPVISSDLEGFKNEVIEDVTGHLFRNNDPADLARVMENVLARPAGSYEALRESQRAFVEAHYSPRSILGEYTRMFQTVMS